MVSERTLGAIWLLLMAITVINALIAETADANLFITLLVAASVALKGRLVVDHFMGLRDANRHMRFWMNAYFYVIPALIVIVDAFPDTIANLTRLN